MGLVDVGIGGGVQGIFAVDKRGVSGELREYLCFLVGVMVWRLLSVNHWEVRVVEVAGWESR